MRPWWPETRSSSMTMSLSGSRPTVSGPLSASSLTRWCSRTTRTRGVSTSAAIAHLRRAIPVDQTRIDHGLADRVMIDHLAVAAREPEPAVHVVVEEGPDARGVEAARGGCQVEALA